MFYIIYKENDVILFKMDRLGQGTWHFGENRKLYEAEIESIRYGIQNGVTLIDTAEMYGDGKSRLYIVSKILPWNAGYDDFFISLSNSLKRLNTSYLDMYLLHWRGEIPLEETIRCME